MFYIHDPDGEIVLSPKRVRESRRSDDRPLYGAMGFVRKSELTKKKKTP